jgi:hypothetical protein
MKVAIMIGLGGSCVAFVEVTVYSHVEKQKILLMYMKNT